MNLPDKHLSGGFCGARLSRGCCGVFLRNGFLGVVFKCDLFGE